MPKEYVEIRFNDGKLNLIIPGAKAGEEQQAEDFADDQFFVLNHLYLVNASEIEQDSLLVKGVKVIRYLINKVDEETSGNGLKTFGRTCTWNHADKFSTEDDVTKFASDLKMIN